MNGVLVTGGERPDLSLVDHLFKDKVYICAADSGLDYCIQNGLKPDYILGDMDSLADKTVLEGFSEDMIEEHSEEKDYTDTELGLLHLKEAGCTEIAVIGGGGGRLDHLIAVLALFDRPDAPDLWYTAREEVIHIRGHYSGTGNQGETVSFFPVGPDDCRMASSGLKWPLDTLCWSKGDVGISNTVLKRDFSIDMKEGRIILIRRLGKDLQSL